MIEDKLAVAQLAFESMRLTPEQKKDRSFTKDKSLFLPATNYFSFGKRKVVLPQGTENEMKRQQSRGIAMEDGESIVDTVNRIKREIENPAWLKNPEAHMHQRIQIDFLNKAIESLKESMGATPFEITGIAELGFRHPVLLCYLAKVYGLPLSKLYGVDIAPASVNMGLIFGINCDLYNLASPMFPITPLANANVVVCWHVLEHVHDPFAALRRIHRDMPPGGLLSVEVPLEDGMFHEVNSQYGHSILFEKGDLEAMCRALGFVVLSVRRYVPGGNDSGIIMENLSCVKMV